MKTYVFFRHFSATKIQLLFKPAILSPNKFSFSIFFLINKISYPVRKCLFTRQTLIFIEKLPQSPTYLKLMYMRTLDI